MIIRTWRELYMCDDSEMSEGKPFPKISEVQTGATSGANPHFYVTFRESISPVAEIQLSPDELAQLITKLQELKEQNPLLFGKTGIHYNGEDWHA